jgi:intracellular multiplication protein IcmD
MRSITHSKIRKALPQVLLYSAALLMVFFYADQSLAADGAAADGGLATIADNVTSNLGSMATLISAASYIAGIGMALAGMVKFKAHRDNPTQTPLSAPLVLLFVGIGLVFLPSIIKSAGTTLFGGGDQITAGSSGQGIQELEQ